jgi:two-component system chemotaxis response regulator CheB
MNKTISVVIADDSPIVRTALQRICASDPEVDVVGMASNGLEALALVKKHNPSVLCTDLHMPKMDGLELTRRVMNEHPVPILVISISVIEGKQENIFDLLEAGAIDVFEKPRGGFKPDSDEARELLKKIKLIAGIRVIRKNHSKQPLEAPRSRAASAVVAIGASTGGPQVLHQIFGQLPKSFPLPILCVQHISPGFLESLITWLDENTPLQVAVARQGERPQPGHIYFPEEQRHLVVNEEGCLENLSSPAVGGHRPAVTMLFNSLPAYYGSNVLAVLLTGMGEDGAEGMCAVAREGGLTIAQDQASSVVFGMPKAAIERGIVKQVLPVGEIAGALQQYAQNYRVP